MSSSKPSAGNITYMQGSSTPTPDDIERANALKVEGNECIKASKFDEAIEKYTQALALKRDPVYLTNRAAAFCHLKKYDEAIKDCMDAISLDHYYAKPRARMGFITSCQGYYMLSINFYRVALELDPTNDNYKENLALAERKYLEEGD